MDGLREGGMDGWMLSVDLFSLPTTGVCKGVFPE